MSDSTPSRVDLVVGLLTNLALELNFVVPGKDEGLLPINSFLSQIEDELSNEPLPTSISSALETARGWVDSLFDRSPAVFDQCTIERFSHWQEWLGVALQKWQHNHPIPPHPDSWAPTPTQISIQDSTVFEHDTSPMDSDNNSEEPSLLLNLDSDRDLLREFVNESQEHLQNVENGVLTLESNPSDADTLNSIFRAFHTFKGGSGFLNLTPIKNLAHELESLLDAARTARLTITSPIIELILSGSDTLKSFCSQIHAQVQSEGSPTLITVPTLSLIQRVKRALDPAMSQEALQIYPVILSNLNSELTQLEHRAALVDDAPPPLSQIIAFNNPSDTSNKTSATKLSTAHNLTQQSPSGSVKVDTLKLDALIDLVGELVIAETMVAQDPDLHKSSTRNLSRNLGQLKRITSELQRTAMSLRMVPIRATFQKMNRLVRDLASQQQKQVQLVLSGEETELDRNIVEEINDPLIHMLRNAADHGIEKPEARAAKGKPPQGTIYLRAFHRGGNIVIQIQDDGNGLSKDKLTSKAIEKGIIKLGQHLSDKEIYDLIFAPGFSTADKITDISGRGVGMDVVRRNIEKLRGKVDIDTIQGGGTTFTIYLPLTLAIIDGMIVRVGSERYIIPTLSVRESFRPGASTISTIQERGEMVNVRGKLCPLLRLYKYFDQPSEVTDPTRGIVVVVESGDQIRCLMVDDLIGKQEVVIKSLGSAIRKNPSLAGGAVLGDGRVGLILNIDSLVKADPLAA